MLVILFGKMMHQCISCHGLFMELALINSERRNLCQLAEFSVPSTFDNKEEQLQPKRWSFLFEEKNTRHKKRRNLTLRISHYHKIMVDGKQALRE